MNECIIFFFFQWIWKKLKTIFMCVRREVCEGRCAGGGVRGRRKCAEAGEVCREVRGKEWVKEKESNEMKKNEQTKIFWENQINDGIVKVCRRLTNQKQIRNSSALNCLEFVQIPHRKGLLFMRHIFFSSLQGIVRNFVFCQFYDCFVFCCKLRKW